MTVDYLDERGVFHGGAILPGITMSARALHEFTDLLPLIEPGDLADPPRPLGRDTVAAMKSGLYWGNARARSASLPREWVPGPGSRRKYSSPAGRENPLLLCWETRRGVFRS